MMKKIVTLVLALLMALSTCACGKTDNADASDEAEKEVIFGAAGGYFGASTRDPAVSWDGWYWSFMGVGETLFRLDEGYNANPWLVESYENVDDYTWVFQLRDDVTFHNGEKMTAESVKKSFEYMMETNSRGPETYKFKEMIADGQVLTIITETPTPALINDLCDPLGVIQYIGDGIDYATESYMTGPYYVTEFVAGEYCNESRYEDYWGGAANVHKIQLLSYADQDAMAMALQSEEIEVAVMPDSASVSLFADPELYTISSAVSTRGEAITFNLDSKFGGDLAVRTAVAYCMDREGYCATMNGLFSPCYGLFPETLDYGGISNLDVAVKDFDIEAAQKLLADAGYADTDGDGIVEKDGQKLTLNFVYSSRYNEKVKFAELLESNAKQAGIEIILIDGGDKTNEMVRNGEYDITTAGGGMAPTGNPQYYINTQWMTGASNNNTGYSNPELDRLAAELEATFDPEKRLELTLKIEQLIMDDMFFIVHSNKQFYCVLASHITGFQAQPSEYYLIDNNFDTSK